MRLRRSLAILVSTAALAVLPLTAWAADPMGAVTTRPLRQAAPALGWPVLVVAALGLMSLAVYRLRPSRNTAVATVSLALLALVGLAYANAPSVLISGPDCTHTVVNAFDVTENTPLENGCSNPIEIVVVETPCATGTEVAPDLQPSGSCALTCVKGMILDPNTSCMLPLCKF